MTHDSHRPAPINRPASNARQTGAGELSRSTTRTAGGGEDFLGLNEDLATHGASAQPTSTSPSTSMSTSVPAAPVVTPGESWLFDSAEEVAPVAPTPLPEVAPQAVEPSPILNTSWSEGSSLRNSRRWVTPLLVTATVAAIGLVGYPALDRATDGPPASEVRLQRAAKGNASSRNEVAAPASAAPAREVQPLAVVERSAAPTTAELQPPRELELPAVSETATASVAPESTPTTTGAESDPFEVIDPAVVPSEPLVRTTDVASSTPHTLESKHANSMSSESHLEVALEPLTEESLTLEPAAENVATSELTPSVVSTPSAEPSGSPATPNAEVLARREARAELRARRKARVEEVRAAALAAEVEALAVATTPEPAATTPEPAATTPEPAATTPEPAATTPEPAATTPEPAATTPEPGATTPEPVATTPEPVATTPEPAATTPEPVATTPEPAATTPEPAATTPEPAATTPSAALETLAPGTFGAPALLEWLARDELCGPMFIGGETSGELVSDPATWSGMPRVTQLDVQSLLLMSRPVGKGATQRPGVWNDTRVPLEEIARATRLATPRIGRVRVTLLSGELFEGRLNAVGEGCVWLDTSYGRMGLNGTLVKSVERLDVAEEGASGARRVRVHAPGGLLTGTLESDDGANASVLLDSGARMTVPSSDVTPLGEAQKDTVRLKRKP
jgi:hypothetical protein